MVENAIANQARRVVNEDECDYSLIKLKDFNIEKQKQFDLEGELSQIVGLEKVKDFIRNQYSVLKA